MLEPNRRGNLRRGVPSQGQKDRYEREHLGPNTVGVLVVFMVKNNVYCLVLADEIVALKRLKMEKEKEGFPITSLREINTILKAQHPNIVTVRVRDIKS